jgi:hypothetical protein
MIVLHHTLAMRMMNASVSMSAAMMPIAQVKIKRARATIPACLSLRILLRELIVLTVLRRTVAMRMVNASAPTNAAKIAIALVKITHALAIIMILANVFAFWSATATLIAAAMNTALIITSA